MKAISTLIIILASILISATSFAAAPTASELVDAAAAKMRSAKSLTVAYTASSNGGNRFNGTFTMAGNSFKIDTPQAKVWYDGKTQWTWSDDAGEVDITEPTIEEVAQVNPYAIISSLRSRYKARYLGNAAQCTVVLTPAMPDLPITRAEIKFDANGYPHRMKLNFPSGQDLTITVSSVKLGTTLPAATFRFKSSDIPGAEVVDLR